MVLSNYNCSQPELYTTCRNAWLLCQQYLTHFTEYKNKYHATFISENLTRISVVEGMDDHEARTAPIKDLRKELVIEKTDVAAFYKHLKGYVSEAFGTDKTICEAMYTEMGQTFAEKLSNGNWTDVAGLFSAMIPFAKTYRATLSEKGYMPDSFLTRLETKQTSFTTLYESWKNQNAAITNATEAKIIANNDLKIRVMAMLNDGLIVFVKDKASAQKFVWTTILTSVRGVKPSGFSGKITDVANDKPISNAIVMIEGLDKPVECDKNGRYEIFNPNGDKCNIIFKAESYETLILTDKEAKSGIISRLNVTLKALA